MDEFMFLDIDAKVDTHDNFRDNDIEHKILDHLRVSMPEDFKAMGDSGNVDRVRYLYPHSAENLQKLGVEVDDLPTYPVYGKANIESAKAASAVYSWDEGAFWDFLQNNYSKKTRGGSYGIDWILEHNAKDYSNGYNPLEDKETVFEYWQRIDNEFKAFLESENNTGFNKFISEANLGTWEGIIKGLGAEVYNIIECKRAVREGRFLDGFAKAISFKLYSNSTLGKIGETLLRIPQIPLVKPIALGLFIGWSLRKVVDRIILKK